MKKYCKLPYLVDLVEDNLRSRFLFPLCALLLYILIVISIANVSTPVIKKHWKIYFIVE